MNSIPNECSKHVYFWGFDCETITLKQAMNIFELMEIDKNIYKRIVEPSYLKTTWSDANHASNSCKIREG